MRSSYDPLLEAPRFTIATEKYVYRQNVRSWMQRVSLLADDDQNARTIARRMGLVLYENMDLYNQAILDKELASGNLKLTLKEGESLSDARNKEIVNKIFELVAKDSVRETVNNLVKLFRRFYTYKRSPSQSCLSFAEEFVNRALEYTNYCNCGFKSANSQFFALVLLENANLSPALHEIVIDYLVKKVKEKSVSPEEENIRTDKERCDALMTCPKTNQEDNSDELRTMSDSVIRRSEGPNSCERAGYTISLDDVVEALELLYIDSEFEENNSDYESNSTTVANDSAAPPHMPGKYRSRSARNRQRRKSRGIKRQRRS